MSKVLKEVRGQACRYLGKDHPGRGKNECKGPEARGCLVGLRNSRWPVWLQGNEVRGVRVRGR